MLTQEVGKLLLPLLPLLMRVLVTGASFLPFLLLQKPMLGELVVGKLLLSLQLMLNPEEEKEVGGTPSPPLLPKLEMNGTLLLPRMGEPMMHGEVVLRLML